MVAIPLEQMVRPFGVVQSFVEAAQRRLAVSDLEALPEASIAWGVAAEFVGVAERPVILETTINNFSTAFPEDGIYNLTGVGDGDAFDNGYGYILGEVTYLKDNINDILRDFDERVEDLEEEEKEEVDPVYEFDEIERKVHVVRVYQSNNPESENWVDVERIDEITFRAPDGSKWKYNLKNEVVS